jgi:hypothetical protein
MPYKGKSFLVASSSHLVDEIVDFLSDMSADGGGGNCGWTREGPSYNQASMDAQDDDFGCILGYFLRSNGEDGQGDLVMHIGHYSHSSVGSSTGPSYAYADNGGAIGAADTTITLQAGGGSTFGINDIIRIDDELIQIGGVSGDDLTSLTRGYGITSPAGHDTDSVVQRVNDVGGYYSVPFFEVFAYRDLTHVIASTSAALTLGVDSAGTLQGLDGYGDDGQSTPKGRFDKTCLMKINSVGHPDTGKMRWVNTYTDQGGGPLYADLTYQAFKSAPGAVDQIDIIPGGYNPAWSRRRDATSSDLNRNWGRPYIITGAPVAGIAGYIYGSKDGIMLIIKNGTTYEMFYAGNVVPPFHSSKCAATISPVSAGSTIISVDNVDIFAVDQKVRILSQDAADWGDNEDRSADTFGGASPGDWHDLDPEELPMEELTVASVGASTVTFNESTIYSYRTGAVIAVDPRPIVRVSDRNYASDHRTFDNNLLEIYTPTPKSTYGSHASHRQRWRQFHQVSVPWENPTSPTGSNNEFYRYGLLLWYKDYMRPSSNDFAGLDAFTDGTQTKRIVAVNDYTSYLAESEAVGHFRRAKGVVPFISVVGNSLGGVSEDTMKGEWAGKQETFRLIYVGAESQAWCVLGPEIA